jgi:serine/threonine protein kinase
MSYLEKKFLIHRDLASRNILVFNKTLVSLLCNLIIEIFLFFFKVKLSDFGLSRLCCSETNYYKTSWKDTLRLPIAWMSPEAITFLRFTSASDVFSFGVCMWECFTYGEMPWQGMTSAEVIFLLFFVYLILTNETNG